jgi:hypothetical protein
MTQSFTQRFEATVSALANLALIAPLVLGSVMFLASSI